ncbi:MAG: hypothetical protein WB998_14270 [Solirubrobacteraceae bacterium]
MGGVAVDREPRRGIYLRARVQGPSFIPTAMGVGWAAVSYPTAARIAGPYNNGDLQAMLAVQGEHIVSYPSRLAGAQRHEGHVDVRA